MMLLVCDEMPSNAADLVPDRLKFKQLLELCQMLCSIGYSQIYKKIPQGKIIQEWIKKHPSWVKTYGLCLFDYCLIHLKMTDETMQDIFSILGSIPDDCNLYEKITTAVLRYNKRYDGSEYPSDTELPIEVAKKEYLKYLQWKNNDYLQSHKHN